MARPADRRRPRRQQEVETATDASAICGPACLVRYRNDDRLVELMQAQSRRTTCSLRGQAARPAAAQAYVGDRLDRWRTGARTSDPLLVRRSG